MAKKFYSIGFGTVKVFIFEKKKYFRQIITNETSFEINAIFGKAYYDKAILDFFKMHSILKDPRRAFDIHRHLHSANFIKDILFHSGLYGLLSPDEKEKHTSDDTIRKYFYGFVYLFYEKYYDEKIALFLFEQNFLHFVSTLNENKGIRVNHEAIFKELLKPKVVKESFGENEKGTFFKIILENDILAEIEGASIKTLRKKAYKILCRKLTNKDITLV